MATSRPPGGGATPQARLGIDLSSFQRAPAVARAAAQATTREISNAFKSLQGEQRLALAQANQTLAVLRAQQSQITATTRAESSVRISAARAEGIAQQQAARAATATVIQEERRKTAAFMSELRAREQANRQSQVSSGAFGRGAATFAGAALGGPIGGLAGAVAGGSLPLAAGLAVGQGVRFAVEASQLATAYNRQREAATSLAGSQAHLNELLATYQRATGGAIDKAAALADTTSLMTQGFADSSKELDMFLRGVRGASVAMGKPQEFITTRLQLELLNQTGMRLNEIGLGMEEVRLRAEALRASNSALTKEQAYQQAVLGALSDKFGSLSKSQVAQATGVEKLTKAWADLRLQMGQTSGVIVNPVAGFFAKGLEAEIERWENWAKVIEQVGDGLTRLGLIGGTGPQFQNPVPSWMTSATGNANPSRIPSEFNADQTAALRRRDEGFAAIERESGLARLEATRSYGRQVASAEAQYQKSILRESQDFARQRLNAEVKLGMSILDVHQDSARQRVKWEEDLARNIAQAQADSAERIADARKDSAKREAETEEKYAKDREKRQRDLARNLIDAAGRLDANQVYELQRNFAAQEKEAKEAHSDQIGDLREQLKERETEEAKALAKSERQQRDANQRRIEEQTENDRLRIEEMKAAFEAQKVEEDAERAIMLGRRAEDHAAQLAEMATAQGERIQQIKDHAQAERTQFTEESNKFLEEVGIHNQAWLDEQERINDGVIKRHTELLDAQRRALLTPGHPSLADPYVDRVLAGGFSLAPPVSAINNSSSSSRSSNVGPVSIVVNAIPGQSPYDIGREVREQMILLLEELGD